MLKCMGASKLCSNVWEQARSPTRFVGERKDARSLRSTRCFLRVWEDSFSGAAYGLSTPKRAGKQLLRPIVFECSVGVVASRRMGLCPDFPELDEGKLSLQGLRPDFSELARKNCPRQGYRALDCGTRFAVRIFRFVQPRRNAILFPALRRLRRSWVQGHAPAAARARAYLCLRYS